MKNRILFSFVIAGLGISTANIAQATCAAISRDQLLAAASKVVAANNSGGFGLPMWVTMVDETGKVCYVVNSSGESGVNISNTSWLGSRVISAQKANTANAFSLKGFAISSGILYRTVHEDNSLFGLQQSNPVDATVAYAGSPRRFGTDRDPLVNKRPGGINVFGGGLALYDGNTKVGAIGVSGDTSCTDHVVAWKLRKELKLDKVPTGFTKTNFDATGKSLNLTGKVGDEIIIDRDGGGHTIAGAQFWDHAACPNTPDATQADGAIILD